MKKTQMASGIQHLAKMPHHLHYIFFFCIILNFSVSKSTLYDQEHQVLLNIKQYLSPFLNQWAPPDSSHCSWPGITCTHESVTKLNFSNMEITSSNTMPPFICDLKNLTYIDFQANSFSGELPKFLYNCSKLEYLDLSNNYFGGLIPNYIDQLTNLRFLNLGYNYFFGDIPASIGRLKELTNLRLACNLFNGSINEIGDFSNLELLDLSVNSYLPPTQFPLSFTKLKKLKTLWMFSSNLIGKIPESIGEMVSLEKLDLSQNNLSGRIPSGVFFLKNLSILYLWSNGLSGEIPTEIDKALNLTVLDVSNNSLTGKIPDGLGKLKRLTYLGLWMNQLSGEITKSLANLPALEHFRVSQNNLSGTLPPYFGRYSPLKTIHIASNRLTGKLPEDLCYNGKLQEVTASYNILSGELPQWVVTCDSLAHLRLSGNSFSSTIPSSIWTKNNFVTLMIDDNKFTGELPQRFSSNLVMLSASKNLLNGSIPQQLTALPNLTTLRLDQNKLTGPLPTEIIYWKSLQYLSLSYNQLSGQIPNGISSLPLLETLDLSNNQLSGHLPPQLGKLSMTLIYLNLSSNNFTGRIPREFEKSIYSHSFLNNSYLCAADISTINIPLCSSTSQRSRSKSSMSPLIIVITLVVSLLAALFVLLILVKLYKTRRKQKSDTSWKLTSFQRLNFTEKDIIPSMTDENVIGRGGFGTVYRVAVEGFGHVAVKKIRNHMSEHESMNAFEDEVKILGNIRHKNILKLLCCISNNNTVLLVCEYLENYSLDRWLIKNNLNHNFVLDWPKRLQIAIGAAHGLAYMHQFCAPPIIHRDIKTSNILLDFEFNAKIADFGLARILTKPNELTMSSVAGSFGYIAPEYVQTCRITEKIDVYSFGVVLLVLATGRKANQGDEHSSLAQWARRYVQLDEDVVEEVLDKEIKEACFVDQMSRVFKLGLMCTAIQPSSRPSMNEVSSILLRCRDPIVDL